jgi:hypothetical protein
MCMGLSHIPSPRICLPAKVFGWVRRGLCPVDDGQDAEHSQFCTCYLSTEENAVKRQHLPLYAIVLVILIVGLAFAGVPVPVLLLGLVVLACPLMMISIMSGWRAATLEE